MAKTVQVEVIDGLTTRCTQIVEESELEAYKEEKRKQYPDCYFKIGTDEGDKVTK